MNIIHSLSNIHHIHLYRRIILKSAYTKKPSRLKRKGLILYNLLFELDCCDGYFLDNLPYNFYFLNIRIFGFISFIVA